MKDRICCVCNHKLSTHIDEGSGCFWSWFAGLVLGFGAGFALIFILPLLDR